ncbi:MAG: SRPBCC family protein [Chloroflexota bacterium]|nr:SRPBCC family protein [Chloroflexota bacterium]
MTRELTDRGERTGAHARGRTDEYGRADGYGRSGNRPTDDTAERVATGLGWFSVGLGLAQVVTPGAVARLVGVRNDAKNRALMRLVGARELGAAVGILSRPRPAGWVWARVAGDAMDLALLGAALSSQQRGRGPIPIFGRRNQGRGRLVAATAAVAGIAGLDLYDATRLTRAQRGGGDRGRHVTKAITVNRPPDEVYRFWRSFENFPRFMDHLESVQASGDGRSHWKARGPAGTIVEWDAEIVEDRPNELIAWRSVGGSDVENAGAVRFVRAPGGRGTEVRVELDYNPPGGAVGAAVASLFGKEPAQEMSADLRAFKQIMELGEVIQSEASLAGEPHPAQPPETVPGR